MATGDPSLYHSQGGGAVPFAVVLAADEDIEVDAVSVQWNGAAAGGAFLACLAIYSQDNVLIARVFPSQQFSVGDTGEVTYAPFLVSDDPTALHWGTNTDSGALGLKLTSTEDILVTSSGNRINLSAFDLNLNCTGSTMDITTNGNVLDIETAGGGAIIQGNGGTVSLRTTTGRAEITTNKAALLLQDGSQVTLKLLAVGTDFTVKDHLGAAIFRVDEDGDLHGLTGKALTFDL